LTPVASLVSVDHFRLRAGMFGPVLV